MCPKIWWDGWKIFGWETKQGLRYVTQEQAENSTASGSCSLTTNFGCHGATTTTTASYFVALRVVVANTWNERKNLRLRSARSPELGRALLPVLTASDVSSARKVANVSFPIGTGWAFFFSGSLPKWAFGISSCTQCVVCCVWTRTLYTSVCNLRRCRCHQPVRSWFMRRFDRDVYVLTSPQSHLRSICYCQVGCIDRAPMETPRNYATSRAGTPQRFQDDEYTMMMNHRTFRWPTPFGWPHRSSSDVPDGPASPVFA